MKVKSLENTGFSETINCFLQCFENYYVQFPNDPEYFSQRWKSAGVRFDLSYGMFDSGRLVGFIIQAIDQREREWIAYNTGTGVLPAYRGGKIIDQIYAFAVPELKKKNIHKCRLEVITQNKAAIKTYERCGFKRTKTYKCFKGSFFHKAQRPEELKEVPPSQFDWSLLPNQELYSWDNHKNSIQKGNYRYFILGQKSPRAAFIINPKTGYIAQLGCIVENDEVWKDVLNAISSISSEVKLNNVDIRLKNKIRNLKTAGLMNHLDQYEMEMSI